MASNTRTSLVDPLLYQSSYSTRGITTLQRLKVHFWEKFSLINFILNIVLPMSVLVFILFVLKERYHEKRIHRHSPQWSRASSDAMSAR
jgi:hypothetical protein